VNPLVADVLGTAVCVDGPEPVRAELRRLLIDLETTAPPVRRVLLETEPAGTLRLVDDGSIVRTGIAPGVGAATAVWWLNVLVARSAEQVLLHSACVGDRGAVLLPGESGTGKSTLAAACVAAGLSYLSDEYAAVDQSLGLVVPYAKPLELQGPGLIAASALRAESAGRPLPPVGIVFPRYRRDAPTDAMTLTPGWTLLALVAHTTNLGRLGASALPWLAALAAACPGWRVTYEDPAAAVRRVRALAATPGGPLRPAAVIGPVTSTTTTVELGDELAVLDATTGRVHLLSTAAALVWTSVPDATAQGCDLVDLVLARSAEPTLDRSALVATVEHLVRCGLLPPSGG